MGSPAWWVPILLLQTPADTANHKQAAQSPVHWRGVFHSQKISYTFGKSSFVFKKNPQKVRTNPFVLKKSRTLFRMSEMPLVHWGISLNILSYYLVFLDISILNIFTYFSILFSFLFLKSRANTLTHIGQSIRGFGSPRS